MIKFPNGAKVIAFDTKEEWLDYRKDKIGGSQMAAVMGKGRWGSPYSVWSRLCGYSTDEVEDNEAMFWGRTVERSIAQGYASRHDVNLADMGRYTVVQHPEHPRLFVTLDYTVVTPDEGIPFGCIEAKNVDVSKSDEWVAGVIGQGGRAPEEYVIQARMQMACTGLDWCDLFALIGGNRSVCVLVNREPHYEQQLIEAYERMIAYDAHDGPPVDEHEATRKALVQRYPTHDDAGSIQLDSHAGSLLATRAGAKQIIDEQTARLKRCEAKLIELMGDAHYADVPGWGRITSVAPHEVKEYTVKARTNPRSFRFPNKPKEAKS